MNVTDAEYWGLAHATNASTKTAASIFTRNAQMLLHLPYIHLIRSAAWDFTPEPRNGVEDSVMLVDKMY
jgi:hypothetical protein